MEEGGVDGHVTVLCLIIYLGYIVSLAIWHTEFVFFRGCPGDLVSSFKMRRKQCCPSLFLPLVACFLWSSEWKGPSWSLRGWHQSHQSWLHAVQRIPSQSGPVLADSPLVCVFVYFDCRSRESHKDVLTLDYCTKQLRERDSYGMSIKTRYVRDQAIAAKTWCFPPSASLLH